MAKNLHDRRPDPTWRAPGGVDWKRDDHRGRFNMSHHGTSYDHQFPTDLGAYDPEAIRWRHFSGATSPAGRRDPQLVFAGDSILMWGGWDLQGDISNLHWVYFDDLYRLNPVAGEWARLT